MFLQVLSLLYPGLALHPMYPLLPNVNLVFEAYYCQVWEMIENYCIFHDPSLEASHLWAGYFPYGFYHCMETTCYWCTYPYIVGYKAVRNGDGVNAVRPVLAWCLTPAIFQH